MQRFPSIVPYGADQTVYLVVEASGPETITRKTERTDIETVITDLLSGRFNDPIEVLAFNTLEHWTDDLSKDIAQEIRCRCDIAGQELPAYLEEFMGKASA
jgi:macrodomain Ter protein organizer (MatP/YcbG family)